MGQHDVMMRKRLWNEINSIYAKIHMLEEKLKFLEADKTVQGA